MVEFELKLESELRYAYFFKGEEEKVQDELLDIDDRTNRHLRLLKKNYILVTKEGEVIIKNLGIRKKSNSEVSKVIFWQHLVPKIKEGECKFSKVYILNLIKELIKQDITMALLRKEVDDVKSYANTTSLAAQIAQKYGGGIHFLLPNLKGIGVGKGKSFCTLEEFKQYNMTLNDLDYSGFINELDYFIRPVITKNIFDFAK